MDVLDMLDVLLPRRCVACSEPRTTFCGPCRGRLARIRPPLCDRCGAPTAWPVARCAECSGRRLAFVSARAAVAYDETARRLVRAWKERGLRRLAGIAADVVWSVLPRPQADVVTFVPADRDRTLRRGHRPAERLACNLAERWELPAAPLLVRTGSVLPQRGLSLVERRRNVKGAFRPCGRAPPAVVLVDDVYTSGSTANAAASALRAGGARRVTVVTFARAVR